MSRIKLSLNELDRALELAVTVDIRNDRYAYDKDVAKSVSIFARLLADGYIYDNNAVTPLGRAFYNSGGYLQKRRRTILRNLLVWLSTVLAATLGSLLASLLS